MRHLIDNVAHLRLSHPEEEAEASTHAILRAIVRGTGAGCPPCGHCLGKRPTCWWKGPSVGTRANPWWRDSKVPAPGVKCSSLSKPSSPRSSRSRTQDWQTVCALALHVEFHQTPPLCAGLRWRRVFGFPPNARGFAMTVTDHAAPTHPSRGEQQGTLGSAAHKQTSAGLSDRKATGSGQEAAYGAHSQSVPQEAPLARGRGTEAGAHVYGRGMAPHQGWPVALRLWTPSLSCKAFPRQASLIAWHRERGWGRGQCCKAIT